MTVWLFYFCFLSSPRSAWICSTWDWHFTITSWESGFNSVPLPLRSIDIQTHASITRISQAIPYPSNVANELVLLLLNRQQLIIVWGFCLNCYSCRYTSHYQWIFPLKLYCFCWCWFSYFVLKCWCWRRCCICCYFTFHHCCFLLL